MLNTSITRVKEFSSGGIVNVLTWSRFWVWWSLLLSQLFIYKSRQFKGNIFCCFNFFLSFFFFSRNTKKKKDVNYKKCWVRIKLKRTQNPYQQHQNKRVSSIFWWWWRVSSIFWGWWRVNSIFWWWWRVNSIFLGWWRVSSIFWGWWRVSSIFWRWWREYKWSFF